MLEETLGIPAPRASALFGPLVFGNFNFLWFLYLGLTGVNNKIKLNASAVYTFGIFTLAWAGFPTAVSAALYGEHIYLFPLKKKRCPDYDFCGLVLQLESLMPNSRQGEGVRAMLSLSSI